MKKLISSLLIIAVLSLAACGGAKDNADDTNKSSVTVEEGTTGQILHDDFWNRITDNPDVTAQELAEGIISNEIIEFMGSANPVEEGFLPGFSSDITGFKEGVSFGPMISVIPFAGYIFTLEEGADVDAFITTLEANANPRWNVCTEAEQTVIDRSGNTVFFLMCPKHLDAE